MPSKRDAMTARALALVGCGYIYGATGWICTRARMEQQMRQYPTYAGQIERYGKKWLGLHNTLWSVIFPTVGWPFGVFLMKQFAEGIPNEMLEAAKIDGAGEVRTFVDIVFPMIKPGVGALAIFTFINAWNDYFLQLIMLNSQSKLTISLGIAKMQAEASTDFGLIMAGATLASVPIITIFLIFQKYFTKGITLGAVKG